MHDDGLDDAPDDDAPVNGAPSHDGGRLVENAGTVAKALRIAVLVLSVPAVLVSVGAAAGFIVHGVLAAVALHEHLTIPRWIWLGLAAAGLIVVLLFLARVVRIRRAAREPEALAAELIGMVDVSALTTAVLADIAEVSSSEGGVRALSRARALWRLLGRLNVEEHVEQFERARWFVPPEVVTSWAYAQVTTWAGLGAWVLVPVTAAARLAGWL